MQANLRRVCWGMVLLGAATSAGTAIATEVSSNERGAVDPVTGLTDRVRDLEERVSKLEAAHPVSPTRPRQASSSTATNPLAGTWTNVAGRDRGIPKLQIAEANGGWTIRGWGACSPTDCDWGTTKLELLGDSVASTSLPYGFGKWDQNFKDAYIAVRIEGDELVAELFSIYKDQSGRANTRIVTRFHRAEEESTDGN